MRPGRFAVTCSAQDHGARFAFKSVSAGALQSETGSLCGTLPEPRLRGRAPPAATAGGGARGGGRGTPSQAPGSGRAPRSSASAGALQNETGALCGTLPEPRGTAPGMVPEPAKSARGAVICHGAGFTV